MQNLNKCLHYVKPSTLPYRLLSQTYKPFLFYLCFQPIPALSCLTYAHFLSDFPISSLLISEPSEYTLLFFNSASSSSTTSLNFVILSILLISYPFASYLFPLHDSFQYSFTHLVIDTSLCFVWYSTKLSSFIHHIPITKYASQVFQMHISSFLLQVQK